MTLAGASFNPAMISKVIAHPVPPAKNDTIASTIRPSNKITKLPNQVFWPDPYQQLTQGSHVGHTAWDIVAPPGTPVFAPVSGIVLSTKTMDPWGWGNSIEILTPDGFHLYFAHLSAFDVKPGQQVIGGQVIGKSGNTFTPGVGHSTGPHLHFEVRTGTSPLDAIDPKNFFDLESVTSPMPAYGTTVYTTGIEQGMGVDNPLPAQNVTPGSGTPRLSSPSTPYVPATPANTADRGSQPKTPAKASGKNLTPGQVAAKVTGSALVSLAGTPQAPASSTTSKAAAANSGETVLAQWNIMDSPILGKITFKITPSLFCLVAGAVLFVIGLISVTWKPITKPILEEGAKMGGAAVKGAIAA